MSPLFQQQHRAWVAPKPSLQGAKLVLAQHCLNCSGMCVYIRNCSCMQLWLLHNFSVDCLIKISKTLQTLLLGAIVLLSLIILLLLIKLYNLCKVLAWSTAFSQLSLSCATFFQLRTFILHISSKTSSSQRVLGLPVGLLGMGFHLLIFWTLLSLAMRSIWPNQFNLCFLIKPNYILSL